MFSGNGRTDNQPVMLWHYPAVKISHIPVKGCDMIGKLVFFADRKMLLNARILPRTAAETVP